MHVFKILDKKICFGSCDSAVFRDSRVRKVVAMGKAIYTTFVLPTGKMSISPLCKQAIFVLKPSLVGACATLMIWMIGSSRCSKPKERLNYNTVHRIIKEVGSEEVNLLEVLLENLIQCGIQRCNNPRCLANKARIGKVAPTADPASEWKDLRDWILVAFSCRSTCSIGHDVLALEFGREGDGHDTTTSTNSGTQSPKCLNGFHRTNDAALFCAGILDELGRCKRWLEAGSFDAFGLVELLY